MSGGDTVNLTTGYEGGTESGYHLKIELIVVGEVLWAESKN